MSLLSAIAGFAVRPVLTAAAPYLIGVVVLAAGGFITYEVHHQRDIGREEVKAEWDAANAAQVKADFLASEHNAAETARRLAAQQANQEKQNAELALARDAAARNARDAGQLREQNASIAKQWRDALSHSPTRGDCAAAGDAIGVFADVLGRADRRAGVLASYADAARAAGLKCERDYDALTAPRP